MSTTFASTNDRPPPFYTDGIPAKYAEFFQARISTYECPSDPDSGNDAFPNDKWDDGDLKNAKCSYTTSRGDLYHNHVYEHKDWTRGMFGTMVWFGMESCTDGTSNTVLVSEQATTPHNDCDLIRGGFTYVAGMRLNPAVCMGMNIDGVYMKRGLYGGDHVATQRGNFIFDGRAATSGFSTILPPNAPSCCPLARNTHDYFTPNSYHTGGVNVAFTDASITFISNTIDFNTLLNNPATEGDSGPSPYGVWGALGTRMGGETTRL